ncbi:MAG: gfo/Idh/MocA family oxidoreductase, partial [Planctomycetota bacterium]
MKVKRSNKLTRRSFLASAAAAVAIPNIIPGSALGLSGSVPPSERIGIGVIGLGIRGKLHVHSLLPLPQCQIVAVSDLFKSRREYAKNRVEKHYAHS